VKKKWILITGILAVVGNGIFFCIHKKGVSDQSLTYIDAIRVSKEAVRFCEQNDLFTKQVFANFLMRNYLTNKYCGYLTSEKKFSNVSYEFSENTEYVVVESFEKDDDFDAIRNNPKLILVKRFNQGIAWSEIYKRNF
jgi:hypothetical protein